MVTVIGLRTAAEESIDFLRETVGTSFEQCKNGLLRYVSYSSSISSVTGRRVRGSLPRPSPVAFGNVAYADTVDSDPSPRGRPNSTSIRTVS